jgi:glycine hydroxymethyltransferase
MADIAHISGLVAAQECNNPFEHCDIVTTTTHKTLRGPRAGIIFFRKGNKPNSTGRHTTQVYSRQQLTDQSLCAEQYDFESKVNFAVFPSLQGGPHENTIAAIAVALKEAQTPEFKQYIQQVKSNAKTMASELTKKGYDLVTGGTDNHLVLWDLRKHQLSGSKLEKLFDAVSITANKNAVYGDTNAISPGGIRLGAPALTSRGFKEAEFVKVVEFLDRALKIALDIQSKLSSKLLKDFIAAIPDHPDIPALREEVEKFSKGFPMPGSV